MKLETPCPDCEWGQERDWSADQGVTAKPLPVIKVKK
jgi:hypothetical protein